VLLGVLQRRIVGLLFRRLQRLVIRQPRVLQQQREPNQRHTETNSDDAKDALDFLICMIDGVPIGSSHRVGNDPRVWRTVDLGRERCVASYRLLDLLWQLLGPDSAGYATAEC
jgi:hypothetical protein